MFEDDIECSEDDMFNVAMTGVLIVAAVVMMFIMIVIVAT